MINPCGITDRPVTSLQNEIIRAGKTAPVGALDLEPLANRLAAQFGHVFEVPVEAVESLAALDDSLREVEQRIRDARTAPTVGVPLKIPGQIELLLHRPERPVRA
jgi:hypothetical protein